MYTSYTSVRCVGCLKGPRCLLSISSLHTVHKPYSLYTAATLAEHGALCAGRRGASLPRCPARKQISFRPLVPPTAHAAGVCRWAPLTPLACNYSSASTFSSSRSSGGCSSSRSSQGLRLLRCRRHSSSSSGAQSPRDGTAGSSSVCQENSRRRSGSGVQRPCRRMTYSRRRMRWLLWSPFWRPRPGTSTGMQSRRAAQGLCQPILSC